MATSYRLKYCGNCDGLTDHTDLSCPNPTKSCSSSTSQVTFPVVPSADPLESVKEVHEDEDMYDTFDEGSVKHKPVANVPFWNYDVTHRCLSETHYMQVLNDGESFTIEYGDDTGSFQIEDATKELVTELLNLYMNQDQSFKDYIDWREMESDSSEDSSGDSSEDSDSEDSELKREETDDCQRLDFGGGEYMSFDYENFKEDDGVRITVGLEDENDYPVLVERDHLPDLANFLRKVAAKLDNI